MINNVFIEYFCKYLTTLFVFLALSAFTRRVTNR